VSAPAPEPVPVVAPAASSAGAATPAAPREPAPRAEVDAALPAEPPPRVKVVTIGMHVGGGPYDEITKEPIRRSVEPQFAELARCWRLVTPPQPKQAEVGVDLVIEAAGGRARVSNPRTTAAGEGFVPCVVAFYEGVDFRRPNNGKTVVSYSVRFTPP
jgi:hypothetical protein